MKSSEDFYKDGVLFEVCENGKCNVDQRSFKAYFLREMAATAELAPFTHDTLRTKIAAAASAAVKSCTGGKSGNKCGLKWTTGINDGSTGVGESMSALEVIQSNLIDYVDPPVTSEFGTSKGDPTAGMGDDSITQELNLDPVSTGDKVGAGFLTAIVLTGILGGAYWMVA